MTKLKFRLLSALYPDQRVDEATLLNKFPKRIMKAQTALDDLVEQKLIIRDITQIHYSITTLGRITFEDAQDNRKSKKYEWIRYIITTIIALAAFVKSFFFS